MWLPYTRLAGGRLRPYLRVWRDPNQPLPALVDSGSDDSSVPFRLAQRLQIRVESARQRRMLGAGGPYDELVADGDVELNCVLGQLVLRRPALSAAVPFIILGRADAFVAYRFAFDQRALRFEIEPYE